MNTTPAAIPDKDWQEVNPFAVRVGDKMRRPILLDEGEYAVKAVTVKYVGPCNGNAGMRHIDGGCYDPRFTSVEVLR